MTDDLISRKAAIDAVYERIKQIGYDKDPLVLSIRQAVREVPSVESGIAKEIKKDAADVMESVVRIAKELAEVLESVWRKDDAEIH